MLTDEQHPEAHGCAERSMDAPATAARSASDPTDRASGRAMEESPDQRLARLAAWCVGGRRAAAELELYAWARRDDCPAAAVTLLASSLWQAGEARPALALLQRCASGHDTCDAAALCAVIAATTDAGQSEPATAATRRLHRDHGHEPRIARWLAAVNPPGRDSLPALCDSAVELLAGELLQQLDLLPTLIAAQRIERDDDTIALLRTATARLLRDVDEDRQLLAAYHALAELAMLAGDQEDARRWAHRGLAIEPYRAGLALILSRIEDDETIGPKATQVLRDALNAHPKYPDLRAALIRREFAEGNIEVARRRLKQWLQREPNQPLAHRLEKELAA